MRIKLLMNILLMFVWVALTGSFAPANFLFGFILSFITLTLISVGSGERKYFKFVPKLILFILFFLYELLKANIQVAYDVITPKFYMKPGIVRVPLDAESNLEITLLANLISLTPGTLSIDVSDDKKVLYVHAMYVTDKEEFINDIKNGFEKRLLDILR